MNRINTLLAYHHKFRFLLEELSHESGDLLKKNRLVEEFQNEMEVYYAVSMSLFNDSTLNTPSDQLHVKNLNVENIKLLIEELNPMLDDASKWSSQILKLKEKMEVLLFHYEKAIESNKYLTQNSPKARV